MTFVKERYPPHWADLRRAVLERAGHCCEGSPRYPDCRAANHAPHPVTGSRVVLTVAHRHGSSTQSEDLDDLRALCQRCHLTYDAALHARAAAETRRQRRLAAGQLPLTEGEREA